MKYKPCYKTTYNVELLGEVDSVEAVNSIVFLTFEDDVTEHSQVDNYSLIEFLADFGGAMGKKHTFKQLK